MDLKAREIEISNNIVGFAEESFPDDLGLTWTIKGFEHRGDLTTTEVERQADDYGTPRFLFVFSFRSPAYPCVIACYEFGGESWGMLFDDGSKHGLPANRSFTRTA